jgi:WD40 repeat protein
MGDVYLARDTVLGRRVALKLLSGKPTLSSAERERALDEARATARFNHPHIVTIHGVGMFGEMLYLALEYVPGETLRSRMEHDPPSLRSTVRLALAVVRALAEAHHHRVLHGDLKPENIMIPADGRLRVLDFGLARRLAAPVLLPSRSGLREVPSNPEIQPGTGCAGGTPNYLAPELWRGEPPTAASDIWSLGVLLYELVAGRRPFQGETYVQLARVVCGDEPIPEFPAHLGVPSELMSLVARCLDRDPASRPSAAALATALSAQLPGSAAPASDSLVPFRGLLPFAERHAELFFGRDAEVDAFLERLRDDPILPIVGRSGVGKSSFVQAGVVPRIREQGPWIVLSLRPSRDPFGALVGRLRLGGQRMSESQPMARVSVGALLTSQSGDVFDLGSVTESMLKQHPRRLGLLLAAIAAQSRSRVLLIVDQLEEICTLVEDDEERCQFLDAVCSAADDAGDPVRVILTLRDDFLGRLAEYAAARRVLGRVTVLQPPGEQALREIVCRPVEVLGYRYEDPKLVDQILGEIKTESASLPLLQFAALSLWQARDRSRLCLTREAYRAVGGISGALATHADGTLAGLTPEEARAARQIFLRMVTPSRTRRVLSHAQALEGLGPESEVVLARLIESRLISASKPGDGGEDGIALELAHESLITGWRQLARWIDEAEGDLVFLADVGQAAQNWLQRGRATDELWQRARLQAALAAQERCLSPIPELVLAFLAAGERRRRTRLWRRRALVGVAVVLLSLIAAVFAGKEREARRERDRAQLLRGEADLRRSQAQLEGARAAFLSGDLLATRANLRASFEQEDTVMARALWWQLRRSPLVRTQRLPALVYAVDVSPDGRTIAAGCQDRSIYLLDMQTASFRVLRGHGDQVQTVKYAPDGVHLVTGTWGGEVWLWNLWQGRVVGKARLRGGVYAAGFSPDSRRLVVGGYGGELKLMNVAPNGLSPLHELRGHTKKVSGVVFTDATGESLVSSSLDGTIRQWSFSAHPVAPQSRVLIRRKTQIESLGLHRESGRVAFGATDRKIYVHDLRTGRLLQELRGHTWETQGLVFRADGRQLISVGAWSVRIWDLATGESRVFREHQGATRSVVLTPDERNVVTGSFDHTVRIWRADGGSSPEERPGHRNSVHGVAFSPDARLLATGGNDLTVRFWDVRSGQQLRYGKKHFGWVKDLRFSPDGSLLASGGTDRTLRLWQPESLRVETLGGAHGEMLALSFSPQGSHVAASDGADILIWNLEGRSRNYRRLKRVHTRAIFDLAHSPDGKWLAAASGDTLLSLHSLSGDSRVVLLEGHTDQVRGVRFTSNGSALLSTSNDGTFRRWSLSGPREGQRVTGSEVLLRQRARLYWFDLSPDGRYAAIPAANASVQVFDMAQSKVVAVLRGHQSEVNMARFSRDGTLLATTSDDHTVRVWRVPSFRPYWYTSVVDAHHLRMRNHQGWIDLRNGSAGVFPKVGLTRHLEADGRFAFGSRQRRVCSWTVSGDLQLWDAKEDKRRWSIRLDGPVTTLLPLATGCLVLTSDRRAQLYRVNGSVVGLAEGVSAVSSDDTGQIYLAKNNEVVRLDRELAPRAVFKTGAGVSAILGLREKIAAGFGDGVIEIVSQGRGRGPGRGMLAEDVPSSPVTQLAVGPRNTLAAGYANGEIGIWELERGLRLATFHLHGPIRVLLRRDPELYAISELGQRLTIDLADFLADYCPILERIWDGVPVVWSEGRAVPRPPPAGHRCLAERRERRPLTKR